MNMKRQGFTLLELIIVIIILGVLASLALPRMFAMTTSVKANEAMQALSLIRKGVAGCMEYGRGGPSNDILAACTAHVTNSNFQALGINNPETEISSHFDYETFYVSTASLNFDHAFGIRAVSKNNVNDHVLLISGEGLSDTIVYCAENISFSVTGVTILGCGAYSSINIRP